MEVKMVIIEVPSTIYNYKRHLKKMNYDYSSNVLKKKCVARTVQKIKRF